VKSLYLSLVLFFSLMLILIGCNSTNTQLHSELIKDSSNQQLNDTLLTETSTAKNKHNFPQPHDHVLLKYTELQHNMHNFPFDANAIEANEIESSAIIIKKRLVLDELGEFLIYVKDKESTELYLGVSIPNDVSSNDLSNKIFEISEIGELEYLQDIVISKSMLFGEYQVSAEGKCGANCGIYLWFYCDNGVPIRSLMTSTHIEQMDIDMDSIPELILTPFSTHIQTIILKKRDNIIYYLNLNDALELEPHQAVVYDADQSCFIVYLDQYTLTYQYADGEDKLILIEDSRLSHPNH